MESWGTIIAGVLAFLAAAYGTWVTYKRGKQSDKVTAAVSKETNAIAWSAQLLERLEDVEGKVVSLQNDVKTLEGEVRTLRDDLTTAINFIESLMLWALGGCHGPMPRMPYKIRKYFADELIEEHERQQVSPKK